MNTAIKNIKRIGLGAAALLLTAGSALAQATGYDGASSAAARSTGGAMGGLIGLVIAIIVLAGMWKVFVKAGHPGWACIIPIYNLYILCKIGGKPGWWMILCFIPVVGIIVFLILTIAIAKNFGKGIGFAMGLFFLSFIFYPILGFGDATYQGSAA